MKSASSWVQKCAVFYHSVQESVEYADEYAIETGLGIFAGVANPIASAEGGVCTT
jgi:hypothetical protein